MRKICFVSVLSLLAVAVGAQNPVQYSVENEITHAYLTDFSYDTIADLNVSYVMDYFNMPHTYRLDAPVPMHLNWSHQADAAAQRLEVSESSTYSDSLVFVLDKDTSDYDLYNLIPGRTYYCRVISVKDDVETKVGESVIQPQGMLRWVYAEGTWNVRDMGGWPGLGGNPIKYGKIFRGAQLIAPKSPFNVLLTASGIEAMRNVGIRAELDLRSASQAPNTVSAISKKVNGVQDVDFLNISESVNARMLNFDRNDANIRELQWIIDELKAGKPVFYHCQNGADRTGTLGFLIGALLGMSEGDLAKDYELTTFCEAAAAKFDPTEKGFARLRNYEGKKGSPLSGGDNADEYKFAKLVEKMKTVAPTNGSYQRKIYNFFLTGKSGTSISEEDLDWFIKEMTDYVLIKTIKVNGSTAIELEPGQKHQLSITVSPADASGTVRYRSSNPAIATVSADGEITAVRGGEATITISGDGISSTVTVNVPLIEAQVPAYALYNNVQCPVNNKNRVNNGSFEYGQTFYAWSNGKKADLTTAAFDVKPYGTGDSLYIESKVDGEPSSTGSIRTEWKVTKNKDYVFGYRVKNSTDLKTENNENLVLMLTTSTAETGQILEYPSYDGNWTDIQVIFNSGNYTRLRAVFSHLSQNGNNTCFDAFYLAEIDLSTGIVTPVQAQPEYARSYDIKGRPVNDNASGLIIKDGRKVLISE